jgi:ankyrin repeat protein
LYLASYGGNAETVRLLGNTADVNLVEGSYGSALATASYWGKAEILHLLLENDADVNLVCGKYGSALAAASYVGNAGIVHLLLEKGADVNLVCGKYGSALAAASFMGQAGIVRGLLENDADVNLVGGRFGGALCAASYGNEAEIVHLLLQNGADVNLAGGDYGSALAAACASPGYLGAPVIQPVRVLLENGADLVSQCTRALEGASKRGRKNIVALLHRRLNGVVSDTEDRTDDEEPSFATDSETSSASDSD